MRSPTRDPKAVFLNVPFDRSYERQFIALVAAVIAVGRKPRCVLEVAETGLGRLGRLLEHLRTCEVSIHDLSRVGVPARFNMPFELGMACALAHTRPPHAFILLEKKNYRVQRTLSDLNGRDPYIHHGSVRGTIRCVLDALVPASGMAPEHDVYRLYRDLAIAAPEIRPPGRNATIFTRSAFLNLVAVGVERATDLRLIRA